MIKVNSKFEQIIGASVARLKALLDPQELQALQSQINALPKKMKQLNAEPYLFVFESMLRWKQLIEPALLALGSMIEQNYITYSLYERIVMTISPFAKDYSYAVIQLVQKVKEPHISFFELYFQIHANVAMPEDILRKFKAQGYAWISKAFQLAEQQIPPFSMTLYSKFYPEQIGHLPRATNQDESMLRYITLIMDEMKWMAEQNLGNISPQRGKNGWCFICHKPANFYCKDTKVPVCGAQCKKIHFQMATNTPGLHYNYSQEFRMSLESLLVENITARRSPALSIDFLVAIYMFSNYIPKKNLHHSKMVAVPVIFQRIWILYLSYYGKKKECCQHIFACCLDGEASFPRQMAAQYFMALAQDPRLFHVYYTFDRCSDFRLLSFVLHTINPEERAGLVQSLVKTAFQHYTPNNKTIIDNERSLIRTLNHVEDLSVEILSKLFGQNYEQKVVLLVLRNETEINRQKLGTLLITNESLCRRFLEHIVKRKEDAPIDELLRQIFYFFNLKVSDKIYRLFELLAEVYIPKHPFNELNFFTYAYFVVMIVTEVNNPNLVQKPTEAIILNRVQQFSPDLAKNHPQILRQMLARVTGSPFRQTSRGLLSHYASVPLGIWDQINPEQIIILNWQIIYESALNKGLEVITIYRICTMVASQPAICQAFLQILVDQLSSPQRDHFLLQSISSIIQLQPNAAGYLWKVILQQSRSVQTQGQSLHLGLIIHSTQQLTDDNFYQFCRQFCSQFNTSEQPDLMLQLIIPNINRIGLVTQLLLSNFQKGDNYYHKITVLKRLGKILRHHNQDQLTFLLLQMMKSIEVIPINQGLILQAFLQIEFDSLPHAQQFWTVASQKCLQFKDENRASLLEDIIKNAEKCQSYESYLIQKTLNCHRMELISEQILKNLNKLQPYLNDISRQVLSLFVLEDNLITIASHFQFFAHINSAYDLIFRALQSQLGVQKIGKANIESILEVVERTMNTEILGVLLKLDKLPCLLIQLLCTNWNKSFPVLNQYIKKLVFDKSNLKEVFLVTSTLSILGQQFNVKIGAVIKQIVDDGETKQQRLNNVKEIIIFLNNLSSIFQMDVQLRMELKRYLKLSNIPTLLKTSILFVKTELKLCQQAGEHHLQVFQILLKQVESVLKRQALVQQGLKSKEKTDSLSKIYLGEANKDALKYGELLVQQALIYLKKHEDIDKKRKGFLRRLLLQLLVQGFFEESSCSFKSLSGTLLAEQINEIFSLLK